MIIDTDSMIITKCFLKYLTLSKRKECGYVIKSMHIGSASQQKYFQHLVEFSEWEKKPYIVECNKVISVIALLFKRNSLTHSAAVTIRNQYNILLAQHLFCGYNVP